MGALVCEPGVSPQFEDEVTATVRTATVFAVYCCVVVDQFAVVDVDEPVSGDFCDPAPLFACVFETGFLFRRAFEVRVVEAVAVVAVDHAFRAVAAPPALVERRCEFGPVFADDVVVHLVAAVGAVACLFVRRWLSAGHLPNTSPLRGVR